MAEVGTGIPGETEYRSSLALFSETIVSFSPDKGHMHLCRFSAHLSENLLAPVISIDSVLLNWKGRNKNQKANLFLSFSRQKNTQNYVES